jgi:hypothetical protein
MMRETARDVKGKAVSFKLRDVQAQHAMAEAIKARACRLRPTLGNGE